MNLLIGDAVGLNNVTILTIINESKAKNNPAPILERLAPNDVIKYPKNKKKR